MDTHTRLPEQDPERLGAHFFSTLDGRWRVEYRPQLAENYLEWSWAVSNGVLSLQSVNQPPSTKQIAALDWRRIKSNLEQWGYASTGPLLSEEQCHQLACGYETPHLFRSHIVMARHGFGSGEYKYYAQPLPPLVAALRADLYPQLALIANEWQEKLNRDSRFPGDHTAFLEQCHGAGQKRPTPLLLKYREGDYNCLHQDLYGEIFFPFQVAFLLSRPGHDFEGGEFVLTEQRPRMQSRVQVVSLQQGEGVIFPVNQRPLEGRKGCYQVTMRHGVSSLRSGERFTLGIIFHDAR